jgi:ABC-type multidrug transport system permease subunit
VIPSVPVAVLSPVLMCVYIQGGFYIPFQNMNKAVLWASWLSFARYGYSALLINEYAGRDIPCAEGVDISISIGSPGQCPLPGEEVIAALGISGVATNYWFNIGMVLALQVIFRVFAYVLLRRTK